MKKILFALIMFAATATVFTGCKKDDKNDGSIEGTWEVKKEVWTDYENGVKVDEGTENYETGETRWVLQGGKITAYEDGEVDEQGTYVYSGNKLTISGLGEVGESMELTVKKLTGSELVLYYEREDEWDSKVYKYVSDIYFVRK